MISILLPIFNGANFFDQCLDSIQSQTYKKWQLVIGINGHGLNSELYKKFNKRFKDSKNVKVYEYDVKSKPQTLNLLAQEVDTEFVALIDVDDKWDRMKLETQIPFLKEYDVVGTAGQYFGKKKTRINIETGKITYERIFFHNCFINSSIIMRREDVDFDDVFLDDYNMWFKLIIKKRKFFNVSDILIYHRLHDDSFFNGTNNGNVNDLKKKWLSYYGEHKIMMDRFGVTVIIPILEDYLPHQIKAALDSILIQTWKGYECIIVIDSDKIIKTVKEIINKNYSEEQKKFLSIKKLIAKNVKPNASYRVLQFRKRQYYDKCMKLGKYNLLAFIEPKDIWKPEKLFHQVFWIHGYDAMCVGGEFYNNKKKNGFQDKIVLPSRDKEATKFYRSAVLIKRNRFKRYPIYYSGKTFLFHRHMDLIKVHYP